MRLLGRLAVATSVSARWPGSRGCRCGDRARTDEHVHGQQRDRPGAVQLHRDATSRASRSRSPSTSTPPAGPWSTTRCPRPAGRRAHRRAQLHGHQLRSAAVHQRRHPGRPDDGAARRSPDRVRQLDIKAVETPGDSAGNIAGRWRRGVRSARCPPRRPSRPPRRRRSARRPSPRPSRRPAPTAWSRPGAGPCRCSSSRRS